MLDIDNFGANFLCLFAWLFCQCNFILMALFPVLRTFVMYVLTNNEYFANYDNIYTVSRKR